MAHQQAGRRLVVWLWWIAAIMGGVAGVVGYLRTGDLDWGRIALTLVFATFAIISMARAKPAANEPS